MADDKKNIPDAGKVDDPPKLRTPLKKCSLTADDGASLPQELCIVSARTVQPFCRNGAGFEGERGERFSKCSPHRSVSRSLTHQGSLCD